MSVRVTRRYWCALILCGGAISALGWLQSTCEAQPIVPAEREQEAAEIRNLLQLETLSEGNSSRAIRDEAIAALPLANLRPANRELAEEILDDISIFRRLPTVRCEMSPEVYSFFRSNPDMAVGIWHVMGISAMDLEQKSAYSYDMATGDGTHGTIHILMRSSNNLLMFCVGEFLNPVTNRTINARALFHLVTRFQRDSSGKTYLTHHADMFVMFPSTTVEAIARMISPVSNRICDQNFEEITLFVKLMDVAMVRKPQWVQALAAEVNGVSDETRTRLHELAQANIAAGGNADANSAAGNSNTTTESASLPNPLPMSTLFGEDLFISPPQTGSGETPSVN